MELVDVMEGWPPAFEPYSAHFSKHSPTEHAAPIRSQQARGGQGGGDMCAASAWCVSSQEMFPEQGGSVRDMDLDLS